MKKIILVLDGANNGKTVFTNTVKEAGFWTWNVNRFNVLNFLAYKIGWEGTRSNQYYDFLEKFEVLANESFDFENWYMHTRIDGFMKNEKPEILIIHKCSDAMRKKLQEEFSNLYSINIVDKDKEWIPEDSEGYGTTLNCKSVDYTKSIVDFMNFLTEGGAEKKE
jgi:hypothetical protein